MNIPRAMARTRDVDLDQGRVVVLADVAAATEARARAKEAAHASRARKPRATSGGDDGGGKIEDGAFARAMRASTEDSPAISSDLAESVDAYARGVAHGVKVDSAEWDIKFPGQRFGPWSEEETRQMKDVVGRWANEHGLAEEFLNEKYDFLFQRRQKQGGRGANLPLSERHAFIELARELPTRNAKQIYGWVLRNMDKSKVSGKWSKEETELLLKLYEEHGPKWSKISKVVGRPAPACRDKWRLAKGGDKKKVGHWSPEETEMLVKLVNEYFEQRGTQAGCGPGQGYEHLTLRDNINWVTISAKLGTRNEQACLQRWYQMSPDMTQTGQWDVKQDSELLMNIINSKAIRAETVEWGRMVQGRSLSQIRRRFNYLAAKIPNHVNLKFPELVLQVATKTEDGRLIAAAQQYAKARES